mmetsp:Transcript_19492/g.31913  ORF Transcript_19492/g.31913 Transcript_19492/m.31913 type:complete len:292 (+) Transcript_19492:205-1080(+)|eukprot:CAMPEP_0184658572 /NCGR_PEP_ID=MMETSP0308-20130426/26001_1 /TAXON_ID=38269 /ORGANISM="Gloeochaete witrockiana, Strain SAG 46.84" /LENGTH=291 /DNA_ID=CAMNT_0027097673 /DNA_START=133 /DNA_END=1008 /DNA_ORIENTATION=-
MAEEIDYYEQELRDLCEELAKDFVALAKLKEGQRRDNKIDQIQERVSRAKNDFRSFNVELRDLPKDRFMVYDKKGKEFDVQIKKFASDLKWAKSAEQTAIIQESRKAESAAGTGTGGTDNGVAPRKPISKRQQEIMENKKLRAMEEADPDSLTGKELVEVASKVQDKSKKSMQNQKRLIEEAKQIGAASAVKLKDQTEQIRRTADKVDEIESNLQRADKIIKAMLRGVARDKLAIGFMFLILVALGFIIYWKASGKGAGNVFIPGTVSNTICLFSACTPTPTPTRTMAMFR